MKSITYNISIIALMLTISSLQLQAQLSNKLELQELGLNFEIPDGWTGGAEEEIIVLGHTNIAGLMVLSSNSSKSATALKHEAEKGIVDDGLQLVAQGDFMIHNNNRVEGFYTGTFNGEQVKGYAIGLVNDFGKGINILILTSTDAFTETHRKEADKLAKSVNFYQAQEGENTTFWKQKLMGKQLYFGLTRGDGSERRTIDLCNDGSFAYYGNSHIAFDESYGYGSANSNTNNTGTYTIYSVNNLTILELKFNNGEIYEYELSTNETGNTFLDNSIYYVQNSERCN